MALLNPCNLDENIVNTGVDCDSAMLATAKLFMVPVTDRFTMADITGVGTFTEYAQSRCQDVPAKRWYPIFGSYAPINDLQEATEEDVIESMPDGSKALVRRGYFNRTFLTTKGGECFANILMRFPRGFAFIEVDQEGKVMLYEPTTGNFGGFPTALAYGKTPTLATFTTVFKNAFYLSFKATTYIMNGKLFASDATEDILSLNGLLDVAVTASTTTQTTTHLFVNVISECSDTDLTVSFPTELPLVANFIVKLKSTGVVQTISAVAIVGTDVQLTGTFISASVYTVQLAGADVLFTNGVIGYDGVTTATITIP